jgi:uncharacterized protein (TIGR03437 family)
VSLQASTTKISLIQVVANSVGNAKTFSLAFRSNTVAGDLILVGFDFISSATPNAITDSQGNTFTPIGNQLTSPGGAHSQIYYAKSVKGGSDAVTINFSANSRFLEVYLAEYSGVDPNNPIDGQAGAFGVAGAVSSGNTTTTVAGDVIYGYCVGDEACTQGSGFTARSTFDGNLIEDMTAANPGTYAAMGSASAGWTMQLVALKPASLAATQSLATTALTVQPAGKASVSSLVAPKAADPQATGLAAEVLSTLSCTPKAIDAGGHAVCELRVAANSSPGQIQLSSTSQQVSVPATVVARANQTRLTFQVYAEAAARQQLVTVTAMAGSASVQDTIQVATAAQPIVTAPYNQAAKRGAPTRFTVSAADPMDLPLQLTASGLPVGATFDPTNGGFDWTPTSVQAGKYKMTFTATNPAGQSSSKQVTIDVTSGDPTLATAERGCSPGAVASLAGSWLAEPGSNISDPSGNAIELGGTKVKVNGQYVPVVSSSSTKVDFVCPSLLPETQLGATVENAFGVSRPLSMVMQSSSPWIFSLSASGQNQGVVSFTGMTELAMARNAQVLAHPAQPGDEIVLWGTGFGLSSEALPGMVTVKLGGVDAEVEGVLPVADHAGVYTVRVRVPVPTEFGDEVPVEVQVIGPDGKQFLSNRVMIAVEPVSQ